MINQAAVVQVNGEKGNTRCQTGSDLRQDISSWLRTFASSKIWFRSPNQAIQGLPYDGFRSDGILTNGNVLVAVEIEAGQTHPDTNTGKYWLLHHTHKQYAKIVLFHIYTPDFDSYEWRKKPGEFYVERMRREVPIEYIPRGDYASLDTCSKRCLQWLRQAGVVAAAPVLLGGFVALYIGGEAAFAYMGRSPVDESIFREPLFAVHVPVVNFSVDKYRVCHSPEQRHDVWGHWVTKCDRLLNVSVTAYRSGSHWSPVTSGESGSRVRTDLYADPGSDIIRRGLTAVLDIDYCRRGIPLISKSKGGAAYVQVGSELSDRSIRSDFGVALGSVSTVLSGLGRNPHGTRGPDVGSCDSAGHLIPAIHQVSYDTIDRRENQREKRQYERGNRIRPIPPELAVLVSVFVSGSILIAGDLAGVYLIGERRYLLSGLLVLLGNAVMAWVMLSWFFGQPLAWPWWWYL